MKSKLVKKLNIVSRADLNLVFLALDTTPSMQAAIVDVVFKDASYTAAGERHGKSKQHVYQYLIKIYEHKFGEKPK